jgi:hypothetical protein
VPNVAYNGENPAGAFWVLALLSDYVMSSGDATYADKTVLPLATELVEFVRLQYPQREQGRMVITLGRAQGWKKELVERWEKTLASVPEVPRGKFRYQGADVKREILPGDQLVPAADMSGCQAYKLPWSGNKLHYQLNAQQTELYAVWPAKLVLRDNAHRECATRSYRERLWQHYRDGWNLDVAFAACLGLQDEVAQWHDRHFDWTYVLPCGLARETAPENPHRPGIPESPSLQGIGTGVIPVLEMLLQDYPDELIVLPCWPENVPVDFTLYSPYVLLGALLLAPLAVTGAEPIQIEATKSEPVNALYADGALPPLVGTHNIQILRATKDAPERAEERGFTYNHHIGDLYYHDNTFYVTWGSGEISEHRLPYRTLVSSSADGVSWSKPAELQSLSARDPRIGKMRSGVPRCQEPCRTPTGGPSSLSIRSPRRSHRSLSGNLSGTMGRAISTLGIRIGAPIIPPTMPSRWMWAALSARELAVFAGRMGSGWLCPNGAGAACRPTRAALGAGR